jgi:hypothetical protein
VVGLAQQLVVLNTTLCAAGTGDGASGGALIGTPPELTQLQAAWVTMGPLFKLGTTLKLEGNDLMRMAQAGSLIFGAGQLELAVRLASAGSLQAGGDVFVDLAHCADRQMTAAIAVLEFLPPAQQPGDQAAAALAALAVPNRQLAVWFGSLSDAMRLVANTMNDGEALHNVCCPRLRSFIKMRVRHSNSNMHCCIALSTLDTVALRSAHSTLLHCAQHTRHSPQTLDQAVLAAVPPNPPPTYRPPAAELTGVLHQLAAQLPAHSRVPAPLQHAGYQAS